MRSARRAPIASQRAPQPARALRTRLDIGHLREQPSFVAARIVRQSREVAVEHHRRAPREIVRRASPEDLVTFGIAGAREGDATPRSSARQGAAPSCAGADLLRHERDVVEDERHIEAVMRAPAAAVDRRRASRTERPTCGAAAFGCAARRSASITWPRHDRDAVVAAKNTSAGE